MPGRVRRVALTAGILCCLTPAATSAQARPPAATEPAPTLRVYLVTMGPGTKVWERFGHNAIWIRDESRGVDAAYNWGLFSFDEPGFLRRFLMGEMMYWMGAFDARAMIDAYIRDDRSVFVQELRLTPAQAAELDAFVRTNALPANRYYRYDYFRDNCSTRVRDALDRALGGRLRAMADTLPSNTSYRWHTRRLLGADFPMYIGTLYGLGEPTDLPISVWEEMYLPMRLREHIRGLTVPDESGTLVPLVVGERQLYASRTTEEPVAPPTYLPLMLALGLLFGGALAWAGARPTTRARRASFASMGTVWMTVSGLLGTGLLLLWIFTDHVFASRNENVLQLGPLALPLIVLLPRATLRGKGTRATRALVAAVAALSLLGFVLQILPGLDQVNGEIIAFALPANLGLALGAFAATRDATTAAIPA